MPSNRRHRAEHRSAMAKAKQAQLMVRAVVFYKLLKQFVEHAEHEPENMSDDLTTLAQLAKRIVSEVTD